jgi:hypothetical protein
MASRSWIRRWFGGVRHEQGHFEQALDHYREALRHKPDLPAAHPRRVSRAWDPAR